MRTMTVENLRAHADELAKAFNIGVVYDKALPPDVAMALVFAPPDPLSHWFGMREKMVAAPPIVDETSYAVVVHELGHHLAPNGYTAIKQPGPGRHPRETFEWAAAKLAAEEAAWDWARYYIEQVFMWTVAMEQTRQYAFNTYLKFRRTGR